MMFIPQKEESKNICTYVNSSIILCYSSIVRDSRPQVLNLLDTVKALTVSHPKALTYRHSRP